MERYGLDRTCGGRENFAGTETIQRKLNGLALLVEGKFKAKVAGKDEEMVIHETLAVLSYDEKRKIHRFRTYLANGITGDHEVKLIEGGWQWGFQFPAGAIRYVLRLIKINGLRRVRFLRTARRGGSSSR